jgi:hypothetical protein
MSYSAEYDHFHVVSICVECAEIGILAIAKDTEALKKFFDTLESDLITAATAAPLAPKNMEFNVEIVIPYQVAKITPIDGHERGHVVVCVAHKCVDPYDFCFAKQKDVSIRKLASELAARVFNNLQGSLDRGKEKKENDQARRLFESLDLPDDLFKGMN